MSEFAEGDETGWSEPWLAWIGLEICNSLATNERIGQVLTER